MFRETASLFDLSYPLFPAWRMARYLGVLCFESEGGGGSGGSSGAGAGQGGTGGSDNPDDGGTGGTGKGTGEGGDDGEGEAKVPSSRLRQEREKREAAERLASENQTKLDALEKKERDRADAEAAAKGEFEKLATERGTENEALKQQIKDLTTERDALKGNWDGHVAALRKSNEDAIKKLPAEIQKMAPKNRETSDPAEVAEWLANAQAVANSRPGSSSTRTQGRGSAPNPPVSGRSDGSTEEQARGAMATNVKRGF